MTKGPIKRKATAKRGETAKPSPYAVFVCYTTEDSYLARAIKRDIEALGAEGHIYEQDISSGGYVLENVLEEITPCQEAIALITPNSIKHRDWIIFEIGAVMARGIDFTPVVYGVKQDAIPILKGLSGVDLNDLQERYLLHLKKRINQQAGKKR